MKNWNEMTREERMSFRNEITEINNWHRDIMTDEYEKIAALVFAI